jgi:hypothetical protein
VRLKTAIEAFVLTNHQYHCFVCGSGLPFTPRRGMRTYCSSACRQWHYRYRKADEDVAKKMVQKLKRDIFFATRKPT